MNTTIIRSLYFIVFTLIASLHYQNNIRAQCSSTGPLSGSVFTDDNAIGVYTISSPGNAASSDNSRASASAILTVLSGNTHYLKVTDFGFSIPVFASICGIEVQIEKSSSNTSLLATVSDNAVRLIKGGAVTGSDYATGDDWPTSEAYYNYGGSANLWGTTWSAADINAANFGVAFSATISGIITLFPSARIDHIRVTVHYFVMPLPLTLTSFKALAMDDHSARLQWNCSNTDENTLFSVQRKTNGQEWQTLHTIPAAASNNDKTYSYTDFGCTANTALYRLLVQHVSGKITQSGVVMVEWDQQPLHIYPNPATDFIFIQSKEVPRIATCEGIDGRHWKINCDKAGSDLYKVNIITLPRGTYILTVNEERKIFIKI